MFVLHMSSNGRRSWSVGIDQIRYQLVMAAQDVLFATLALKRSQKAARFPMFW
jgi:hypothetical protein